MRSLQSNWRGRNGAGNVCVGIGYRKMGTMSSGPRRFEDDLANRSGTGDLLLPERARLLYIGPPKTGTTSVQRAASAQRRALLDSGVRYPGTRVNHRREFGAFLGFSVNKSDRSAPIAPDLLDVEKTGVPDYSVWESLKSEIDAEDGRRIWLTHECVSQANDESAKRVVDELDTGELHVAITLRPLTAILPSWWTQLVQEDGLAETFDEWIDRIFGRTPDHPMPDRFNRAYDHGELVTRWARLVGPDNVTVVIGDTANPSFLTDAFEKMLGVPDGLLRLSAPANRSLTAVEAELFRALNEQIRDTNVGWKTYKSMAWRGARDIGSRRRKPPADEPKVRLPEWAANRARQHGAAHSERIRAAGVRVVGDLNSLHAEAPTAETRDVTDIPVSVAATALADALIAGQKLRKSTPAGAGRKATESNKTAAPQKQISKRPAASETYTTRELSRALATRLIHKMKTGRSKPIK